MVLLSPARRRELRAAAHHLNPVVSVAEKGLTANVVAEIDRALATHELIKVRIYGEDRATRDSLMEAICEQVAAVPVQHIGKLLVLWREKPADAVPAQPVKPVTKARPRPAAKPSGSASDFVRSARARALGSGTRQGARKAVSTPSRNSGHRSRSPQR
jgi:RNA-binding protein